MVVAHHNPSRSDPKRLAAPGRSVGSAASGGAGTGNTFRGSLFTESSVSRKAFKTTKERENGFCAVAEHFLDSCARSQAYDAGQACAFW